MRPENDGGIYGTPPHVVYCHALPALSGVDAEADHESAFATISSASAIRPLVALVLVVLDPVTSGAVHEAAAQQAAGATEIDVDVEGLPNETISTTVTMSLDMVDGLIRELSKARRQAREYEREIARAKRRAAT